VQAAKALSHATRRTTFIDGSLDAFAMEIVNKRSTIIEVLTRLLFWQPADRQDRRIDSHTSHAQASGAGLREVRLN